MASRPWLFTDAYCWHLANSERSETDNNSMGAWISDLSLKYKFWAVNAVARSLRHLLDRHDVFNIA